MSSEPPKSEFEQAASEKPTGLWREVVDLLKHNRKWWLVPIIAVLALVGVLLILAATSAAPFIYPLF